MKIKYLMDPNPKFLTKKDPVYKACLLFFKYKLEVIPIIDDILVGAITPNDIVNFYAKYKTLNVNCGNVMNKNFYSLNKDDSLEDASELFSIYGLNYIFIINNNHLEGLLLLSDLTHDEDLVNLAYNAISRINIM